MCGWQTKAVANRQQADVMKSFEMGWGVIHKRVSSQTSPLWAYLVSVSVRVVCVSFLHAHGCPEGGNGGSLQIESLERELPWEKASVEEAGGCLGSVLGRW